MHEPEVALVFSPEQWVETLHRYLTDHGGARLRQLVLDPTLALEEQYGVLVVSHRWPGLTRGLVDAVHREERSVLGVYDPDEPAGHEFLTSLGVDGIVSSEAPMGEFLDTLLALVPAENPLVDRAQFEAVLDGREIATGVTSGEVGARPLVVIGGPPGAGATELAIGIATAINDRGERVALVDADEVVPSVAQRLGLPIEPNLRSAIEAVEYVLGRLDDSVARLAHGLEVVCGLPNVVAWAQVRPGEVLDVVDALARTRHQVVANVASRMEDVGRGGHCRYGTSRRMVSEATVLVGVGAPTPVGVSRLLSWVVQTKELNPRAPVHLVVNRAPRDLYRRAEIEREIRRTFPPATLSFVPHDTRVETAAWAGTLVARGPFTRAVAELVSAAMPAAGPLPRGRDRANRQLHWRLDRSAAMS